MSSSNNQRKTHCTNNQTQICPKCSFENKASADYCEICFCPLDLNSSSSISQKSAADQLNQSKWSKKRQNFANNFKQELKNPNVLIGLVILGCGIVFWINDLIIITHQPTPTYITSSQTRAKVNLYESMGQVKNVPQGLFSYGGALYFASLVAHGMNDAILQNHLNFDLRYTKPQNQDSSYSNGIKMLLNGELSFAFNGRPLTDQEYTKANLRGISLQQIPIALDGIVFFGNNNISVKGLTLNQAQNIFTGKITNWQQLGGENLPIVPVLLTPENIKEILGSNDVSNVSRTTEYVTNYTQALRKVIATPGAISFASASLVQNQKLIKIFSLAESNSTNYVDPFIAEKPNLELFKRGTYPLTRRLFLVFRQDGTPDQLAGKAYAEMLLSNEGQKIVEQAGLLPLYGER